MIEDEASLPKHSLLGNQSKGTNDLERKRSDNKVDAENNDGEKISVFRDAMLRGDALANQSGGQQLNKIPPLTLRITHHQNNGTVKKDGEHEKAIGGSIYMESFLLRSFYFQQLFSL